MAIRQVWDLEAVQGCATAVKQAATASFGTIAVMGLVLGVRHLGGLQRLELLAFDHLVRLTSLRAEPDPRILVVAITEQDIERQQQWPISDGVLAQALQQLQAHKPTVIGLDLYRNIPIEPGHKKLIEQFNQPNLIAIRNIDNLSGTKPPPTIPPERIGFNDLPLDPDDVVRRNILFAQSDSGTLYSFSLQLAIAYLEKQGISPQASKINPDYMQLGQAVFVPLTEKTGGYQTIEAAGYQILLNYRSSKNIARQVTLSDVLSGKVDSRWIKDKIVVIGSTAPSLKDGFVTPYSPVLKEDPRMVGVFVHVQMLSQLLDAATGKRPLFWFWPEWVEIVWIVCWIGAGSLLGRATYHPLALSIGVALGLGACTGVGFYLFIHEGWVPLAAPALGFFLGMGAVVSYKSYQAHQQHQIVMELLGQNTSPEIAQALWRGRERLLKSGKLPGTRLTATLMFVDIKGFSTISEQMAPEALLEWLNELLEVMTQEVLNRKGIVNKFTGDGVMAVFGVPISRRDRREVEEDAREAVACAMTISDHLEELNQKWHSQGLPMVQMRIGIFTGPAVVGSLGGKNRLEYGVIGDSVNTAARLESCEKHRQPSNCRILIGKETLVHLEGQFEVESWGLLALKGKQQMVEVYRVVRSKLDKPDAMALQKRNPK